METEEFNIPAKSSTTLQSLKQRHYEMISLHVLGAKNKDIAEALNVTPQNVSDVLNSPLAQRRVRAIREERDSNYADIQKRIQEIQPLAVDIMEQAMISEDAPWATRKSAAKDMLEMGGHKAPDKRPVETITPEQLSQIKDKADAVEAQEQEFAEAEVIEESSEGVQ